jgi:magnesium-transporting ATPase (P-type)
MNPLLLPEYIMEKIKRWSERRSWFHGGSLWNIIIIIGLTIVLGILLSGAPYVVTYFEEVRRYDAGLLYGYNIFFMPSTAGERLSQTSYEMIYVIISYILLGTGFLILVRGSKTISQKNITILTGIILLVIALLLIQVLDHLKITTRLS